MSSRGIDVFLTSKPASVLGFLVNALEGHGAAGNSVVVVISNLNWLKSCEPIELFDIW
ncbi:unnamed protein product [Acidithrix sp. C25]|nr:unnamed protein product [Acidithrix sp. C25]